MAKVRKDLVGCVYAVNEAQHQVMLTAGQDIPEDYFVGGHAVEDGDENDQTPPWATPPELASVETVPYVDPITQLIESGTATPEEILASVADRLGIKLPAAAEPAPASGDNSDAGELAPPPLVGAGSSTEAWRAYAGEATKRAGLQLDIADDAKRSDIVDALKTAGIPTE